MVKQAKEKLELQILRWPKVIVAILMILSTVAGGGAALATQMARINALETELKQLEKRTFSKDQAETIRQILNNLDQKMDIKFDNIDKRLDGIEKKL